MTDQPNPYETSETETKGVLVGEVGIPRQKKSLGTGVVIACVLGGLLAPCILAACIQWGFGLQGNGSRMNPRERPWYPLRDLIPAEDRVELDKDWNELLDSAEDSVDRFEKDLNKGR